MRSTVECDVAVAKDFVDLLGARQPQAQSDGLLHNRRGPCRCNHTVGFVVVLARRYKKRADELTTSIR